MCTRTVGTVASRMWCNHVSLTMWLVVDATHSHTAVISLSQLGFRRVSAATSSQDTHRYLFAFVGSRKSYFVGRCFHGPLVSNLPQPNTLYMVREKNVH